MSSPVLVLGGEEDSWLSRGDCGVCLCGRVYLGGGGGGRAGKGVCMSGVGEVKLGNWVLV